MSTASNKHCIGVYSELAVQHGIPTVYYKDINGKRIEVCAVFTSVEEAKSLFKWKDMTIVSTTLNDYISSGRRRSISR